MDITKAAEIFQRRLNQTNPVNSFTQSANDKEYEWKICQRCCAPVPKGNKFCSNTCEQLFKQRK